MSDQRGLFVIVAASRTPFCVVCHGEGDALLAPLDAPELAARVRCLHCGPLRLPLVLVPTRTPETTP